jgi:hypothetical protein
MFIVRIAILFQLERVYWNFNIFYFAIYINNSPYSFLKLSFEYMENEIYATIDRSSHPIIQVKFHDVSSNDHNFQQYLDEMNACYDPKEKIVVVFDASTAAVPKLKHQRLQATWLEENKTMMQDYCLGTAYVIPNAGIRAVLRMIFTFQKQPVAYEIFDDHEKALEWASSKINKS